MAVSVAAAAVVAMFEVFSRSNPASASLRLAGNWRPNGRLSLTDSPGIDRVSPGQHTACQQHSVPVTASCTVHWPPLLGVQFIVSLEVISRRSCYQTHTHTHTHTHHKVTVSSRTHKTQLHFGPTSLTYNKQVPAYQRLTIRLPPLSTLSRSQFYSRVASSPVPAPVALTCWPSPAASLWQCSCSQTATSASAHKGQAPTDSGQDLPAGPSTAAHSRFEPGVLEPVWHSSQRGPIADETSCCAEMTGDVQRL